MPSAQSRETSSSCCRTSRGWTCGTTGSRSFLPGLALTGNVTTLRALNLRDCPLQFPPQLVVQEGPASILTFLRACASQLSSPRDPASQGISPTKMNLSQLPHPLLDLPGECASKREITNSQGPKETRFREMGDPFPPVEKLDLSELRRVADSWEEWPSEEEIRRFWRLRQEIVEKEQADVLENQLLAAELPPNLRAMLRTRGKARPSPTRIRRKKAPSFKGSLPGLASAHPAATATQGAGLLGERRTVALRELREKQELTEQRRSSADRPSSWCFGPWEAGWHGPRPQCPGTPHLLVGFGLWGVPAGGRREGGAGGQHLHSPRPAP